jgi:hypothetical protein
METCGSIDLILMCLFNYLSLSICNENQLYSLFILNLFRQHPVHISGLFIANHQEVFNIYVQELVRVAVHIQ